MDGLKRGLSIDKKERQREREEKRVGGREREWEGGRKKGKQIRVRKEVF